MVTSQSAKVDVFDLPLPEQFKDIVLKLRRARQHTEAFNRAAYEFWKSSDIYEGTPERDAQGGFVYLVTRVASPPAELGLFIGEAAHQLRSSLDHLMWLLARPKTPKEESNVQFPIVSKRARWKDTRYRMPGVPRGVRALVEQLQPYHSRKRPQTALLSQLQTISNWDKHRTFTTTGAGTMITESEVRITGRVEMTNFVSYTPILEVGAILARFEVTDFDPGSEVYMKPKTTVLPQFDQRMPEDIRGRPVYDLLVNCGEFIYRDILPQFARFF
jgi:hypothetical protein